MNPKELQTAKIFYSWILSKLDNYPDMKLRKQRAKQLARELWDEYHYPVIAKVIKNPSCATIRDFERLALQYRELKPLPPIWTPPN